MVNDIENFDETCDDNRLVWGLYVPYALRSVGAKSRPDLDYIGHRREPARFGQGLAKENRQFFDARFFGSIDD